MTAVKEIIRGNLARASFYKWKVNRTGDTLTDREMNAALDYALEYEDTRTIITLNRQCANRNIDTTESPR